MRRIRLALSPFLFAALACFLHGQSVRWEPSGGSLANGQVSELQLVFESCEPTASFTPPAVSGLTLQANGQMSSTNIINGAFSKTVTFSYAALVSTRDRLTIPAFSIETDKGTLRVPAASFEIGEARFGNSGASLSSVANSQIKAPLEVWAGEVFPLAYTLSISANKRSSISNTFDWTPAPLLVENWSKLEKSEAVVGGERRALFSSGTRGLIPTPGSVTLNQASHLVQIATSVDIFGNPTGSQFAIPSDQPKITVKALPLTGRPASFNGAVGKFTLESKIVPATAAVGEPITWTLTLSGTGNWSQLSGLPAREASKDFRVVQPQAKRTDKPDTLFDASLTEDAILIPSKPGTYSLGPVRWSYFDPAKGEYQTITTERINITVTAPLTPPPPTPTRPAASASSAPTQTVRTPPADPHGIPKDPLPGSASALQPLRPQTVLLGMLSPIPALLALWGWLAYRRARRTDPLLARRQAQQRLTAQLATLTPSLPPEQLRHALQLWQHDTARLWSLAAAVPTAADFAQLPQSAATAQLWLEAERCLYRADTALPTDWVARASRAVSDCPLASFSVFSLFRVSNLFPAVVALGLLFATAPSLLAAPAEPGRAAYNQADFPAAEKVWRDQLAQNPADWIAHHNLALALAQQNRTGEAAAHAAAAFVHAPADASVRWHLALTQEKAGFAFATISAFTQPSLIHELAATYSPAQWQYVLFFAAGLLGSALILALLRRYGHGPRWLRFASVLLIVASALSIAAALLSLHAYGLTTDTRAVLAWKTGTLRSVPTEADTAQKTTPLAAGSLAIADRSFLGWQHLVFENGQTGWIRREDISPLWQPLAGPPAASQK